MAFLGKKSGRLGGVIDIGSSAIKALLFEGAEHNRPPRPIQKFVWDLPVSYTVRRLISKIRESVFEMVRRVERMPERIIAGLGPLAGEFKIESRSASPEEKRGILARGDIRDSYEHIFESDQDLRRAVIVTPLEVLINGYPLIPANGIDPHAHSYSAPLGDPALGRQPRLGVGVYRKWILPFKDVQEITFRILSVYMPVESGAVFADIKNSLGGVPIEFLPLVAAEKEGLRLGLGIKDALVVDVGGEDTSIFEVRDGRFGHAAFIPFGARNFAERLAKKRGHGMAEASEILRQYSQGMTDKRNSGMGAAEVVSEGVNRWKRMLARSLDSFYPFGPLPPAVFLAGGGARLIEIRQALAAPDWIGDMSYTDMPSVRVLDGAAFFGGDTLGGTLAGPEDAGLASLLIYYLRHRPLF